MSYKDQRSTARRQQAMQDDDVDGPARPTRSMRQTRETIGGRKDQVSFIDYDAIELDMW